MENEAALISAAQIETVRAEEFPLAAQIIEFYEEAGIDYEHWSKNFNMHFGCFRWGMNPFRRELMLEQMNAEVCKNLKLNDDAAFLIDLGCGFGATARHIARKHRNATVKGVTLVPWQVEKTAELNAAHNLDKQIEIFKADFHALPFADQTADGVFAVESACYGEGAGKQRFVAEMARVLKTGGRFVVADCFVKRADKKFNFVMKRFYESVCRNWFVPEMANLDEFVRTLEKNGMRDVVVEDISWQIAPSVAHAPFAVLTFIAKKMLAGEKLKPRSINNLKASLLALPLGLNRSKISYCLISGTRS